MTATTSSSPAATRCSAPSAARMAAYGDDDAPGWRGVARFAAGSSPAANDHAGRPGPAARRGPADRPARAMCLKLLVCPLGHSAGHTRLIRHVLREFGTVVATGWVCRQVLNATEGRCGPRAAPALGGVQHLPADPPCCHDRPELAEHVTDEPRVTCGMSQGAHQQLEAHGPRGWIPGPRRGAGPAEARAVRS